MQTGIDWTVGIIGYGNMGSSFAKGLKSRAKGLIIYDKDPQKQDKALQEQFPVAKDLRFLVKESELILLAVKPKDAEGVLEELRDIIEDRLLVSIVAGLSISKMEELLGKKKIIRTMPNINVVVQKGVIAYCPNGEVKEEELKSFTELFSSCGSLYLIEESLMDVFTALAGSGPAFVFKFISALILSGIRGGLSYELSRGIVLDTILGSCEVLKELGGHPEEWITKVASPAGTTIEGIKVLEDRGFSGIVMECIHKSWERSRKIT